MSEAQSPDQRVPDPGRRSLIKWAVLGTGAVAATALGVRFGAQYLEPLADALDPRQRIETPENDYLTLSNHAAELSLAPVGVKWAPDGHITYATFADGSRTTFITGDAASYAITGNVYDHDLFTQQGGNELRKPQRCFGPDAAFPYRNGYSGILSVFQPEAGSDRLYALTHNEQWKGSSGEHFTATVGLLESHDRGLSWEDKGPWITGQDVLPPGEHVSGAGQPCAMVREVDGKRYVYTYYVDWAAQKSVYAADQIYLARAELVNGALGQVEHFTRSGFKTDMNSGEKQAVLTPPSQIANASYAALPGVSYNTNLGQYLATFETNVGVCIAKSPDGVAWQDPQLILRFPQPQSERKAGDVWFSYPTLLSPSERSDQQTSDSGILYFSSGRWQETPHNLVMSSFTLK